MKKTIFRIDKMDCPAEEQLIRMKLDGLETIIKLDFEISDRTLIFYHIGDSSRIETLLSELNLGTKLISDDETTEPVIANLTDNKERSVLWIVLIINFAFFILEMLYGWISNSMGLIADSLDMLADSFVYGLSLMVVGHSIIRKKKVAKWSGYFQIGLATIGLVEVLRRFFGMESMPIFQNMIIISILALIANSVSLYLIQKVKSKEARMQASVIFTSNDIIINIGIILAGVLVYFTQNKYPDLIIGTVVFGIVLKGAFRILTLSK
jgi:Co/Zn/Cd efflux system component